MAKTNQPDEWRRVRDPEIISQRTVTIGMLIFSVTFCALVFWAGWKEAAAYERCGLKGASVGGSCSIQSTKR